MSDYQRMLTKPLSNGKWFEVERAGAMTGERWSMVKLRGIAPYTIDRVEGTYTVGWRDKGSRFRAYDLRLPDGKSRRFSRLADAKAYVRMLQEGGAA
jgi:hypothetical protein